MRYLVSGICMLPMEAEMIVDADSPEHALALAQAEFSRDVHSVLVAGSADNGAAYDWRPEAVPA